MVQKKLTNHFLPGAVANPRMHILYLQEDSRMHLISKNRLQGGVLMIITTNSEKYICYFHFMILHMRKYYKPFCYD